jgi:hypothetical protein
MESQLQFCRDLFSALLSCKEGCKVPASITAALVHACQRLMLEAVQLQQVGGVACASAPVPAAKHQHLRRRIHKITSPLP